MPSPLFTLWFFIRLIGSDPRQAIKYPYISWQIPSYLVCNCTLSAYVPLISLDSVSLAGDKNRLLGPGVCNSDPLIGVHNGLSAICLVSSTFCNGALRDDVLRSDELELVELDVDELLLLLDDDAVVEAFVAWN